MWREVPEGLPGFRFSSGLRRSVSYSIQRTGAVRRILRRSRGPGIPRDRSGKSTPAGRNHAPGSRVLPENVRFLQSLPSDGDLRYVRPVFPVFWPYSGTNSQESVRNSHVSVNSIDVKTGALNSTNGGREILADMPEDARHAGTRLLSENDTVLSSYTDVNQE